MIMDDKRLFLLDAYALIFRAYYALMRNPRFTSKGVNTSAIFGFVNILEDLLKRETPSHIAVCFDPGGKTFRHEQYPQYKANRDETPEGIKVAVPYIKQILEAYGIKIFQVDGFEADDVIGTLAVQAEKQGFTTYMVTGDKDFGQLVTDNIKIYHPGDNKILGVEEVKAKHGISSTAQVIDLLGLMGDTADNIPGCPGVGPKKAELLIQQFGSVENMLAHTSQISANKLREQVEQNADQIRFSKFLATIKTDVPITLDEDEVKAQDINYADLKKIFTELEFKTLTERIIKNNTGAEPATAEPAPKQQNADRQMSLFGFDETGGDVAVEPSFQQRESLASKPHDYKVLVDSSEVNEVVQEILTKKTVGVCFAAEGDEAMRANLVGIAVCADPRKAYYFPLDGFGWVLQAIAPLFAGNTTIIGNDIKRMKVMLHCLGIEFTAPYYDVAVAHYLLQPERTHSTAVIAGNLLNYEAINEGRVFSKGKGSLALSQMNPESVADYFCEQADMCLALMEPLNSAIAENGMTSLLTEIELPLIPVLADMEIAGVRIDVASLNEYSVSLTGQVAKLEEECYNLAGVTFNTASPAQVGEILFDRLKIDSKAKKTRTGQYSTTEEILLRLQDRHPLVGKILELRGIRKLLSTYVNALPALINPRTGRIHTTFNQTVTATGRLSSVNPNLQNIPVRTEEGREIRRAFIPTDGNVFFSADYSQIELRLVADLSGDPTMLEAFREGHDIHAITAAKIYHETIESVTPEQRRRAKTANFGILYGISAFGLSERLQIPRSEAKMLIDGYFATFPLVQIYIDNQVKTAREKGYVTTIHGRRRLLPDINSRNAVVRSFSERNATNAPIQGSAADIIKIAMVRIWRRFREEGLKSKMILQVHDELNFDVVPQELELVQRIVVEEMEGAYSGKVRLTASHAAATNWLDAH